MKILILKPSSLGDVIQALPVLRLLRRHLPSAEIHWWIESSLGSLLEGDPDLDRVVLFERHRWALPLYWSEAWQSVEQMRAEKYDWVIDLQALARSSVVAWLVKGRLTVGLDDTREGAAAFFDIRVPRPAAVTHAVDWYLEVLRALQVPVRSDFDWLPARRELGQALLARWRLESTPFIALAPGARWATKRWPAAHYTELVRLLAGDLPRHRFVLLGASGDQELARTIAAGAPHRCLNLTGQTTLPELIECLRASELLITNDTGPMHVSAALGRPLVALFGPTDPRLTGPYRRPDQVLQQALPCLPCLSGHCENPRPMECLETIPPARVRQAAGERLRAAGTGIASCQSVVAT